MKIKYYVNLKNVTLTYLWAQSENFPKGIPRGHENEIKFHKINIYKKNIEKTKKKKNHFQNYYLKI